MKLDLTHGGNSRGGFSKRNFQRQPDGTCCHECQGFRKVRLLSPAVKMIEVFALYYTLN
jgi:hypothetical protein